MATFSLGRSFASKINGREAWEKFSFTFDDNDLPPEQRLYSLNVRLTLLRIMCEIQIAHLTLRYGVFSTEQFKQVYDALVSEREKVLTKVEGADE